MRGLILLLLISYTYSQQFNTHKIRACIELVGYKLDEEEDNIENIMDSTLFDSQATMTKIMCDLFLCCWNSISDEEANYVIDRPMELRQDLVDRLTYDQKQFSIGDLKDITEDEIRLLDEMFVEIDKKKTRRTTYNTGSYSTILIYTILFIISCMFISYMLYRSTNSFPFRKPRVLQMNRV